MKEEVKKKSKEKKLLKFLKDYSPGIQAISTICLVIITIWYACSTANIMDITRKEFEISNRPYISIDNIEAKYNNELSVSFSVINRGKIPARIISFDTEAEGFSDRIDETEMILNPEETKIRILGFNKEGIRSVSFDFQTKIYYYSLVDKEQKYKYCIEYYYSVDSQKAKINLQKAILCE